MAYLISEHGLGNAVDVAGFVFKRSAQGTPRRGFTVIVDRHWNAQRSLHSRFLRALAKRIIAEPGLFRVILGPADPSHHDHFHFDMARFRIVNVF